MKVLFTLLSLISLQTCISSTKPIDRETIVWQPTTTPQEGLKKPTLLRVAFGA